jgi:inhibitor of cysteine peptidase
MFQRNRYPLLVAALTIAALCVAACGPGEATPPPGGDVITGEARVSSVEILLLESFPVQVRAAIRGSLPDGCTEIDEVTQERQADTFYVTLTTVRPRDAMCTEAEVPFEEMVELDVYGLEAGTYTVDANRVTATFTLSVDNELPTETP